MTPTAFRKLALSLPAAHESPHFERTSFRVGTKIFATMTQDGREAMIPVHPIDRCLAILDSDRDVFIDYKGWTLKFGSLGMRLPKVDAKLVKELMTQAHARVTPKPKPKAAKKTKAAKR